MKVLSVGQIKEWDQYTITRNNIRSIDLMEQAARVCASWLENKYLHRPFMIFCGPGNNGGDGLAIGRLLHEAGYAVQVFLLDTAKHSFDFDENLKRLQPLTIFTHIIHSETGFPEIDPNAILVDAIYGTGLNKAPSGLVKNLVDYINNAASRVISIDVPTGMFCDIPSSGNSIIKANHTLSFGNFKRCFLVPENLKYCGDIVLLDIGLSPEYLVNADTDYFTIHASDINRVFKPRPSWVHKYNCGHVLVYAGSSNMMGAALLTCRATMRAGAGLVTIYNPHHNTTPLNTYIPEAIISNERDVEQLFIKKNAVCFGPGLVVDDENAAILQSILKTATIPLLIDAAGISLLKRVGGIAGAYPFPIILTPHAGEFDLLFGKSENDFGRMDTATRCAKALSIFLILKGPNTMVACPDGMTYFNTTGNSGMATAGSGDVLSGIITSLLAQGYDAKEACLLGVYLHGWAGDLAAQEISKEALVASDIIDQLGNCFLLLNEQKHKSE